MKDIPSLYLVIPCYNEEAVLPITAVMFSNKIKQLVEKKAIRENSRVLFVDDGSKDSTWEIIRNLTAKDEVFMGISLSRNRGHQNALVAGLMEAKDKCDITISLDCDGQDDIDAVDKMIKEYMDGAEIVYGVRDNRDSDTAFKRFTAQSFYKLLNALGADTVYNHADYRLVSAKALEAFSEFKEVNLYLRGMFPLVGFKSTCFYYRRQERVAGSTHYPLRKMLALAFDGITSLSIKPIRIITSLGVFISIISLGMIIYALIGYITENAVPGWASTLIAISMLSGVQLISIGVIGEYVGKIYLEVKHRPRYIIEERAGNE